MAIKASELQELLLGVCEDDRNTEYVDQLIQDAREAILEGGGVISSLANSSVNGKSFGQNVHLDAAQVLKAARNARIEYLTGQSQTITSTRADFRRVDR